MKIVYTVTRRGEKLRSTRRKKHCSTSKIVQLLDRERGCVKNRRLGMNDSGRWGERKGSGVIEMV